MSVKNFVQCGLVTPVAANTTELVLMAPTASYQYPPLDGGTLVIADSVARPSFYEIISYTHRIENVLYGVVRAKEGTTARAWSGVTWIYQALTAQDYVDALALKAALDSPALTGTPTAPTAPLGDNTNQIATMAAIKAAIDNLVGGAPGALDALNEFAAALGNDPNFATTMTNALAGKEPSIAAGTSAQMWLGNKTWASVLSQVQGTLLTGLGAGANTPIVSTDTLIGALAKIQNQLNNKANFTDPRLSDAREWTATEVSQAEAEAGTATIPRKWTALRVWQAVLASSLTGLNLTVGTAVTASDTVLVAIGKLQKQITDAASNLAGSVRATVLTGYVTGSNAVLASTDTVLAAFGKLQAQITGLATSKLDANANAVSATKLQTARTIGGVAFDGTANINLPGVNAAGNQNTTGNAGTATKLQTARTINGVAFDGTANITVADSTKLPLAGGTMTGAITLPTIGASWIQGTSGVSSVRFSAASTASSWHAWVAQRTAGGNSFAVGQLGETWYLTWASNANIANNTNVVTNLMTASSTAVTFGVPVYGNGSGLTDLNAAALATGTIPNARLSGTYTGVNITGNAATATKLATARTISVSGAAVGFVNFDGSSNAEIVTTTPRVNPASDPTSTFRADVFGGVDDKIKVLRAGASGYLNFPQYSPCLAWSTSDTHAFFSPTYNSPRIRVGAGSGTGITWQKDLAFTDSDITGNAATATKLQTARTINGVSFDGTANITVADSTKLPLSGGKMTGALAHQFLAGAAGVTTYRNLAVYTSNGTVTGTMKITLPFGWTSTMMSLKLKGYNYNVVGAWELSLGGYNYVSGSWVNTSASTMGTSVPFSSVRFAFDGTKACILLGNTASTWNYPKVIIEEMLAGFSNVELDWGNGWSITVIQDETGLSAFNEPVLNANTNALLLNGRDSAYYLDAGNLVGTVPSARLSGTYGISISGNAGTANRAGVLNWTNYGGGQGVGNGSHVIFDASNSVSPSGKAVNNTNPDVAWVPTYPTLMGWNGTNTFGVRVDRARYAEALTSNITINGVAANVGSNITVADSTKMPLAGGTFTGTVQTRDAGINSAYVGGSNAFHVMGGPSSGAVFTLHRAGTYAINIGLDTDNVFRIGGWSDGETHRMHLDSSGNFTARGNVTAYSDIRLKTDIKVIPEALDKVTQLRGVTYKRIDSGERQTGLIAQEVQKVLPEAVQDTGDYLSVAYGNLVGLLVEAIKELRAEVADLRSQVGDI